MESPPGVPPDAAPVLPPEPQPPQNYDCCGGGCADCELKIYQRELARWKKQAAAAGQIATAATNATEAWAHVDGPPGKSTWPC